METLVAQFLAEHVDERIERRRPTGAKDRGDISGARTHGQRLVIECKDTAVLQVGPWLNEVEVERGNDDALAGVVVAKRRGHAAAADQIVLMTLADLASLLTGQRVAP